MDQKLTPIKAVVIAIASQTETSDERSIEIALSDLLNDLISRAEIELENDEHSAQALSASRQLYVFAQMVESFGKMLLETENMN